MMIITLHNSTLSAPPAGGRNKKINFLIVNSKLKLISVSCSLHYSDI